LSSRATILAIVGVLSGSIIGCAEEEQDPWSAEAQREQAEDNPLAGLYTPGNRIGYVPPAGSSGIDAGTGLSPEELAAVEASIREAGGMDRCALPEASEGTPGTLTFSFDTRTYGGFYEPENCGAVWIEDTEGRYVDTPLVWAEIRLRNLFIWDARRCDTDGPDVISSATLPEHGRHEGSWSGKDYMGRVVPDGTYVLNIEVTEDEFDYGRRAEIPFEKGGEPVMLQPDDFDSVTDLTISYTPEAAP
jgi:hypothetical protein